MTERAKEAKAAGRKNASTVTKRREQQLSS